MNQTLEIVVRPDEVKQVQDEFRLFIERAKEEEWDELKVLFGFAWGIEI